MTRMTDSEKFEIYGRTFCQLKDAKSRIAIIKAYLDAYVERLKDTAVIIEHFMLDPSSESPDGLTAAHHAKAWQQNLLNTRFADMVDELQELTNKAKALQELVDQF